VEAVRWYLKAAEQNCAAAQHNLGTCYKRGEGVAKDYVEAVQWYRKAAEQNDAEAQDNLGFCYATGEGVGKDYTEAVKWYRKAAEQNYAPAQYILGTCCGQGQGVGKDLAEAVKWFRKAAEQNYADAQFNLGACYCNGDGVTKDYVEAYKWWLLSAAQGYAAARQNMTVLERQLTREQIAEGQKRASDFKATEVPSLAPREAEARGQPPADLRAQVATGEDKAQNEWRTAFHDGKQGVAKDSVAKVKWFRNPESQNERSGDQAKHEVEAYKWFLLDLRAKAEKGDPKAQNELGEALYAGKLGVTKDAAQAVKWFRQAADQNLSAAQSNLGLCCERGDGVAKYEVEAYKWDLLAAAQGDSKAKHNASLLELLLSPEEIAEGKRRAQAWLEQRKKASTNNQ
jgi:TPR repeat protein